MTQVNRIGGGLIDRSVALDFSFNGKTMYGHPGDTLASALLANGQKLVARSFKYHRPRGIFASGSEEPNALVRLRTGAHAEPNTRATTVELFPGLAASSQNHLGSLHFDLLALNDLFAPILSAGFYYKTFMWPRSFWEKVYEPLIRRSAGLGALSGRDDPDAYDKGFLHCDLLVIGSGPAGLSAALAAGRSGARIILAEEDFVVGGRLNAETLTIDGRPGSDWASDALDELSTMKNARILTRTAVYGAYDHGVFGALERRTDHLPQGGGKPRQVLWRIHCRRSILASGSIERPIAFGNNDRPGIMLAGAVRTYVNRFGVAPGKEIAVFTNNDSGWRTATDLSNKGVKVRAVIDTRDTVPIIALPGTEVFKSRRIVNTSGRSALRSITLSDGTRLSVDCLAVAGGWNPTVQLACHQGARAEWNSEISAFAAPRPGPDCMALVGAAKGSFTLREALAEGHDAAKAIVQDLGFPPSSHPAPTASDTEFYGTSSFWHVAESRHRAWVDLQNDVTVKDVQQASLEGMRSIEHVKRYTTLGMGTDQGKTANALAIAVLATTNGTSVSATGTTTARPPYVPVALGALAGRARGKDFRPYRLTPAHAWAQARGAEFVETGNWLRARWFAAPGETHWRQSVDREVKATRSSVGICDVTTLGKIDVQGNDAGIFLDKIYVNNVSKLPVGRARYGLMLREDGIAFDDGTIARLGHNHFVISTTTANAVSVLRHLEFCRQCLCAGMDVQLISITDAWAQFAVAGPKSRALLMKLVDSFDLSNDAFPFMACGELTICGGVAARLFRISFSGELAYELAVPRRYGHSLINLLMKEGEEFGAVAYGVEALSVMRIEKGHVAGSELDGRTTALNLGLERMLSANKDFIGKTLSQRSGLRRDGAPKLMGFVPLDRNDPLMAGAHFVEVSRTPCLDNDLGWMSSVAFSPTLGHFIGLGFIENGPQRKGDVVRAVDLVRGSDVRVEIVSPHFVDPDGSRLRG